MQDILINGRAEIAAKQGLEIVSRPTGDYENNNKYLLYRFLSCKHEQNIDVSLVKKGLFKCRQCEQEHLEKSADSAGLVLLERAHKGTPGLYRFKECGHEQRIGYHAVSNGLFRCRECYYAGESIASRNAAQAEKQGLEYVDKVDASYARYRKVSCGHLFDYQVSAIKAANKAKYFVHCPTCKQNDLDNLCNNNGVEFVSKEGDQITYKYGCGCINTQSMHLIKKSGVIDCENCKREDTIRLAKLRGLSPENKDSLNPAGSGAYVFDACGHRKVLTRNYLTSGYKISCLDCKDDALDNACSHFDITNTGDAEDRRYFKGIFNACGHDRLFLKTDLRRKPKTSFVICPTCVEETHKKEAEEAGLCLISKADNEDPNYRKYKFNCCGSELDLEITHVRRKSFICRTCQSSKYDKPTYLYVFKMTHQDFSWLKVGVAIDLDIRIGGYGLPEGCVTETLWKKQYHDGYTAVKIEKSFHTQMKRKKLCFKTMKDFHTTSGFTECYPVDRLSEIISKLEDMND